MKGLLIYYPATMFGFISTMLFILAEEGALTLFACLFTLVAWFSEQR